MFYSDITSRKLNTWHADMELLTFLLSWILVNIEWTRHVLLNMAPNDSVKPIQNTHVLSYTHTHQTHCSPSAVIKLASTPTPLRDSNLNSVLKMQVYVSGTTYLENRKWKSFAADSVWEYLAGTTGPDCAVMQSVVCRSHVYGTINDDCLIRCLSQPPNGCQTCS